MAGSSAGRNLGAGTVLENTAWATAACARQGRVGRAGAKNGGEPFPLTPYNLNYVLIQSFII